MVKDGDTGALRVDESPVSPVRAPMGHDFPPPFATYRLGRGHDETFDAAGASRPAYEALIARRARRSGRLSTWR